MVGIVGGGGISVCVCWGLLANWSRVLCTKASIPSGLRIGLPISFPIQVVMWVAICWAKQTSWSLVRMTYSCGSEGGGGGVCVAASGSVWVEMV